MNPKLATQVIYPDSDGLPMSDNTKQFRWIVMIKENLEIMYAGEPEVFIGGDLLWYPVEGSNTIRCAPDAMVVFGRPKGDRGSYKQWEENNIPPRVVFEILSPGNTFKEMLNKLRFYEKYGVSEYYMYDPDRNQLEGWIRTEEGLKEIEEMNGWSSPALAIRFQLSATDLTIYRPDGQKFLTSVELENKLQEIRQQAAEAIERAERAEARVKMLEDRLRESGIQPD